MITGGGCMFSTMHSGRVARTAAFDTGDSRSALAGARPSGPVSDSRLSSGGVGLTHDRLRPGSGALFSFAILPLREVPGATIDAPGASFCIPPRRWSRTGYSNRPPSLIEYRKALWTITERRCRTSILFESGCPAGAPITAPAGHHF